MRWVMGALLAFGGPLIAWSILCGIRDAIHARLAQRDLPVVARELGLKTRGKGKLPELHGKIDGFVIRVREAAIEIELRCAQPLEAAHMAYGVPPPYSWIFGMAVRAFQGGPAVPEFSFGDRVLDRYFAVRRVRGRADGDAAAAHPPLQSALRRLVERHGRLSTLRIADTTIYCEPWVGHSGSPKSHSISGAQVRALMPDLLDVARALEASSPASD